MKGEYLTGQEVIAALGVGPSVGYALLRSPNPPFRVERRGRLFRVHRADLERYQREGASQASIDLEAMRRIVRDETRAAIVEVLQGAFLNREYRTDLLRAI